MFLALRLRAREPFDWMNDYGYGIMGWINEALRGTPYDRSHDNGSPPPYTFSEIRPFSHEVSEGQEKYLLIASPESKVIRLIAEAAQSNPRLSVGEMRYEVRAAGTCAPTVGDVGDTGWLQTVSGINLALNTDAETDTYWPPKQPNGERDTGAFDEFRGALHRSVRGTCRQQYVPEPDETTDLFDGYELVKTFAHPVTVTSGQQITIVRSHWRLRYEVRDETHRKQLDTLHRTGVGQKTGYGMGALAPVPTADLDPGEATLYTAERAFGDSIDLGGERPTPEASA